MNIKDSKKPNFSNTFGQQLIHAAEGAFEAAYAVSGTPSLNSINERKHANTSLHPAYDRANRTLNFAGHAIELSKDSDQEIICCKLFRAGAPLKQGVERGDLYIAFGVEDLPASKKRRKIYSAKDALNLKVAKKTSVDDLFIIDKKLMINPKYL